MMEKVINKITPNDSSCPKCDLQTRIIGFIITFLLGFILLFMSFGALGGVFLGAPSWFALLYSLGTITALCSSFFLVGPQKQCKNMLNPKRLIVSIVLVVSVALTLIFALFFGNNQKI